MFYPDGKVQLEVTLKVISRCPACNRPRLLVEVTDTEDMTWREERHRTDLEEAKCEIKMFPPWEDDKWDPWYKKHIDEVKWRWKTEWRARVVRMFNALSQFFHGSRSPDTETPDGETSTNE